MGIPIYFHVITQSYPNTLRKSCPKECKEYFMDFNGAIHQSAQKVIKDTAADVAFASLSDTEKERRILDNIWSYTAECVKVAKPSGTVHICIDGVAPVAKMIQQRKRRYISMFTKKLEKTTSTWDTNAISPGTPFMSRLQAYLRARIRDDYSRSYYLSGSDDPGEGEHKIFARLATLDPQEVAIIYGLDADLIMLSLMSHHQALFLMREPTGPYKDQDTEAGFLFMDIHAFRVALLQELQIKYRWPVTQDMIQNPYDKDARKVIEMYVCVCFLLGNDFLPHPLTLSLKKGGHDALLMAAKNCLERDIAFWDDQGNPSNEFFVEIIDIISKDEDNALWKTNQDYLRKKPFTTLADNVDSYPLQPEFKHPLAKQIYEMKNSSKWRSLYYQHMFHTKLFDTSVIRTACTSYVQGLHWTYRYYKRLPKDPLWYYPYGYPPTLKDLKNFMESLSADDTQKLLENFVSPPNKGFVSSDVQLLCIMPKDSYAILPAKVKKVMTNKEFGCTHLFPSTYQVQTYLKTHLWECNPVLPWIDVVHVQNAVDQI